MRADSKPVATVGLLHATFIDSTRLGVLASGSNAAQSAARADPGII